MSGGYWDYLDTTFRERADEVRRVAEVLELLAVIEHEMDWGYAGDTCRECAKLRTIAALVEFFNAGPGFYTNAAIAIARDDKQNRCERCIARGAERKGQPTVKAEPVDRSHPHPLTDSEIQGIRNRVAKYEYLNGQADFPPPSLITSDYVVDVPALLEERDRLQAELDKVRQGIRQALAEWVNRGN